MQADAIVIASFKISIPSADPPGGNQCFCEYLYIVCAVFCQGFIQTKLIIFFFFIPFNKFVLLGRTHSFI
uniref:Candidate secreted effector n=1 Tax=Meloidogyne incognita TaxID=6306 RepID=A0A914KYZ2_MELIC